jgi:hypothetical protein
VSFPYSNAGYLQLFGGETAECLLTGLQAVFERLGGVPPRLIFDNASAVGRNVAGEVRLTELFQRFQAHYGFTVTLCTPYSGYEKGHVENKVGYLRRHLLVPRPTVVDLPAFNQELLARCEADWARSPYKKHTPIAVLLADDRAALGPLPRARFDPVRSGTVQTDGYGQCGWDGAHDDLDRAGIGPPDSDRPGGGVHPPCARPRWRPPRDAPPAVWQPADGPYRPAHPAHSTRPEPRRVAQQPGARGGAGRSSDPPRPRCAGCTPRGVARMGDAPRAIRRSGGLAGAHRSGPAGPGRGRRRHGPRSTARDVGARPAGGSRTGSARR